MQGLARFWQRVRAVGILEKKEVIGVFPIHYEETNAEIYARIAQSVASKYGCEMRLDFQGGSRKVEFLGDEACKHRIAAEIQNIFRMP